MICPLCMATGAEVSQTMDLGGTVNRRRRCRCGCRWTTEERVVKTTISSPHLVPRYGANDSNSPPVNTGIPPVSGGGVGGGLSSGQNSVDRSVPSEQSGSVSEDDQEADRARVKAGYPMAFEAFWETTWGVGSKGAAFRAWKKAGSPLAASVVDAIAGFLGAKKESGEIIGHVSTWLNSGGHLQVEWKTMAPTPAPRAVSGKTSNNMTVLENYARKRGIL